MVAQNAQHLEQELAWLGQLLHARMQQHLGQSATPLPEIAPPNLSTAQSHYADFIAHYDFGWMERAALMLAAAPHLKPQLLDVFYNPNPELQQDYTEFGGVRANQHKGFIPTAETLLFLLAGNSLAQRFAVQELLSPEHLFAQHQLLLLEPPPEGNPPLSGTLHVSEEVLDAISLGETRSPTFSAKFPARRIQTSLTWDDLVLPAPTLREIGELRIWLQHQHTLMDDWGMGRTLRPGYRCLYYGAPGTGKTMTACLLGQATGHQVYHIDLSMIISKYIGETEKNLARIFDKAEHKQWILFFDEADALFGQRTKVEQAHDRYANQEVSYLLQRLEQYHGVVILASNHRQHLDSAFTRRFESIIHFPMPDPEHRARIWQHGFSTSATLSEEIDLHQVARDYELSGGSIMNVIRYSSLRALERLGNRILLDDLEEGIRKELWKEGKSQGL